MSHRNKKQLRLQREMKRKRKAQAPARAATDSPRAHSFPGAAGNDGEVICFSEYEITFDALDEAQWPLPPQVREQFKDLHDLIVAGRR